MSSATFAGFKEKLREDGRGTVKEQATRIKEFMNLNKEQEVVLDLDSGIFVEAGAGSGKTGVLVAKYLYILEQGKADVEDIVAITFTENAAAEMRDRIRKGIREYIEKYGEVNFLNKRAIKKLPNAPISTIHGFSARILQENPLESMLNPGFSVIEGIESRLFIEEAIDEFILELWESKGKYERELLAEALAEEGFDLKKLRENISTIMSLAGTLHLEPPWNVFSKGRAHEEDEESLINFLLKGIQFDLRGSSNRYVQSRIEDIRKIAPGVPLIERNATRARLLSEIKEKLSGILGLSSAGEEEKELAAQLLCIVDGILNLYDTRLTRIYLTLVEMAYEFLQKKKKESDFLDYEDLLKNARNLLRDNTHLLNYYRYRFTFIMVDEFQDTDELQFEIINLLCGRSGANLFVVGDPKQSIFRFRGGDLGVFLTLRGKAKNLKKLSTNFRSTQSLLKFFNGFFGRLLGGLYENMTHFEENISEGHCTELMITLGDTALEWRRDEVKKIAERILEIVEKGYCFSDIAILLRSRKYMYLYESALQELGIPCYLASGSGFFGQQEVRDLVVFLRYLIYPKDRIAEACVLRSTFLGASDDELLAFYSQKEKVKRIVDFLNFASSLRSVILSLTPASIIEHIIEETGYGSSVLALPKGEARYANLNKLLSVVGRLEALGLGVAEILDYLEASFGEDTEPPAQAELEGENSVKILTVHKAKGLEFPIVVLVDLNHSPGGGGREKVLARREGGFLVRYEGTKSNLWESISELENQDNIEEEKRILYVAKTRAKKLLIMCIGGRKKTDGKISTYGSTFADFLNSTLGLPPNCEGKERIVSLGLEIPLWKGTGDKKARIPTYEQQALESLDITEIERRFTPILAQGEDEEKEKPIFRLPGGKPSQLELGSLMHRFLELWDFREESIKSTARFAITEGFLLDDSLAEDLAKLAKNFLNSELMKRIKKAKRAYREVPFYIEINGKPERGRIDLVLEEDDGPALFDYKVISDDKELMEFRDQMERYAKALERKFGITLNEKFFVVLPDVRLVGIS